MKTIETIATVNADRQLTIQLPLDILPETHQVVLVIDDKTSLLRKTSQSTIEPNLLKEYNYLVARPEMGVTLEPVNILR